jgi:hypothetical protein
MKGFHLYLWFALITIVSIVIATSVPERKSYPTTTGSFRSGSLPAETIHERGKGKLPATKIIKKRYRVKRKPNEPNEYLSYTSFSDLIKNRPRTNSVAITRDYMDAFSNHPDVRNVDLQQDELTVAKQLSSLRDPNQDSSWQRILSYTIKRHLKEKGMSDEKSANIRNFLHGQRLIKEDAIRMKHIKESSEAIAKRKQRSKDFHLANKERKVEKIAARETFIKDLDRLVQFNLSSNQHQRFTAPEIAKIAENFRAAYPEENIFRPALKSYFQRHGYSNDEIIMAQSARSQQSEKLRRQRYTMKKKGQAPAGPVLPILERMVESPAEELHTLAKSKNFDDLEDGPWWDEGYFGS